METGTAEARIISTNQWAVVNLATCQSRMKSMDVAMLQRVTTSSAISVSFRGQHAAGVVGRWIIPMGGPAFVMAVTLLGVGDPQLLIAYCMEVQMIEPLCQEMVSAVGL